MQEEEPKMTERAKKVIKKVASKLTKASKAHAGQAKALSAIKQSLVLMRQETTPSQR